MLALREQLTLLDADVVNLGALEFRNGVHAVLTVEELEHLAAGVAHGAVVFDDDVLNRLHKPALDVARLRRLDRGVDGTLAPTHRVEKALLRREAAKVRVLVLCIVRSPSATVVSSLRRTDQSRFVKFLKKMGRKKVWEEKFQEHYSRVNVHTQLP